MYFKRPAYLIVITCLLALAGCGDKPAESETTNIPTGIVKVKFAEAALPPFLTATGLSEAKSWGRKTADEKVKLKFGSPLPNKFVLTILAKAPGLNLPVPVRVGEQVQTIKLEKKKMKPVKLTFTTATPTDLIEIEIPQTVIKGRVNRMPIALVGFELEAIK